MARDLDLKRRLELAGLTVTEVTGWRDRGSSIFSPRGSVNHHTAGPRAGAAPSLGICINGRADLPGPLCNVFGPRESGRRVFLVAAGRANHAGRGGTAGLEGNSSVYGLEEEHSGTAAEPLTPERYDRMVRTHAGFAFGRFAADEVVQHWEWTSRKIDFVRAIIDPVRFRSDIEHRLRLMADGPKPPPPVLEEDPDMPTILRNADDGQLWNCDGATMTRRRCSRTAADYLVFYGMARLPNDRYTDAPAEMLRLFDVTK